MQYLFNAPEGFARVVLEHKVRPSQHLRAAFLTQLQPHAAVSTLLYIMPKNSAQQCLSFMLGVQYAAYLYPDAIILLTDFLPPKPCVAHCCCFNHTCKQDPSF